MNAAGENDGTTPSEFTGHIIQATNAGGYGKTADFSALLRILNARSTDGPARAAGTTDPDEEQEEGRR